MQKIADLEIERRKQILAWNNFTVTVKIAEGLVKVAKTELTQEPFKLSDAEYPLPTLTT